MRPSPLPEHILRSIWLRQAFRTSDLHTANGAPVNILFPGRLNTDGGPDCVDARIRIGNTLFHGDVELHVADTSWNTHRHSTDPHYNRVILHVVLTTGTRITPSRTASKRSIPVLILDSYLDDASFAANPLRLPSTSDTASILCRDANDSVPTALLRRWLTSLGRMRIELRVRIMHERLQQLMLERRPVVQDTRLPYRGSPDEIPPPSRDFSLKEYAAREPWDQLLYENIMEGMGYAKNRQPFIMLARSVRLTFLRKLGLGDSLATQAVLFGAAGLLPPSHTLPERDSRDYVRQLRRRWKELRPVLNRPLLHEGDWLFFRLRPSNFPTARLAAMCFSMPVLFGDDALRLLISAFKEKTLKTDERLRMISSLLSFVPDVFWSHHVHFRGSARDGGIVIGEARILDLTVNTLIPFALLYGRTFKDHDTANGALGLLASMPPLQENVVTRLIHRELVRQKFDLASPVEQQGALQLYKRYCRSGRCEECDVGRFIGFRPLSMHGRKPDLTERSQG